MNSVLADFAKVDAKTKRLVVRDGVGPSLDHKMDWAFNVWVPALWERPSGIAMCNPYGVVFSRDADKCPPPQIDVYIGGNVRWSDVVVPKGIELSDERLEAHGFTPADGMVLEGKVVDLTTRRPLAAKMRLESVQENPRERTEKQPNGHYRHIYKGGSRFTYVVVAEAVADAQGRWVLKHVREGPKFP